VARFAVRFALIHLHRLDNVAARPSSGSHPQEGMVIVPCSMGTLGAVASGAGTNLIHRAADVTLKESRVLCLCRARRIQAIHLENMLRLSRAGAHIVPASPVFIIVRKPLRPWSIIWISHT